MEAGVNRSGIFNEWSMGKKSLLLNVAKPKGMEIVKELIEQSDVVVDNFATGVMDNLGLSYDELKQIKPDIIVASISGFGHSGPRKKYMGYGPAMAPVSGLSSLTGYRGGSAAGSRDFVRRPEQRHSRRRGSLCRAGRPETHRPGPVYRRVAV